TFLERIVVDGRAVDPKVPARVGPGVQRVEFDFTAFQFAAPSLLRFHYKLEGFDTDWVDAGTRRAAYYTSLPPGQYMFRAEASNDSSVWGADPSAAVTLAPRFYQTRWFIAFGVLAVGMLGFVATNARTARLKAQERRLQAMVDERTRELQEAREAAVEG